MKEIKEFLDLMIQEMTNWMHKNGDGIIYPVTLNTIEEYLKDPDNIAEVLLLPLDFYDDVNRTPFLIKNHPSVNFTLVENNNMGNIPEEWLQIKDRLCEEFKMKFPTGNFLFNVTTIPFDRYIKIVFDIRIQFDDFMYWVH